MDPFIKECDCLIIDQTQLKYFLAQLVEHLTADPKIKGLIPGPVKKKKKLSESQTPVNKEVLAQGPVLQNFYGRNLRIFLIS
jgi:hypothetical protein